MDILSNATKHYAIYLEILHVKVRTNTHKLFIVLIKPKGI